MRSLLSFILIFILAAGINAQEIKLRPLNKKKWKELVNEVNSKRYDPKAKRNSSQSDAEKEYGDLESEDYKESGQSEDGENGIYDTNDSKDDDLFFDESKDKEPKEGDPLDPKYEDNESGTGNGDGGPNNSYRDNSERDVYYKRNQPSSPSRSNSSSSSSSASGGGDSTWLLIIMIAVLAAAVIYMIVVSFSEKNKKVNAIVVDENKFENLTITKTELELALEAALKDKNYREAVRIYFIAVIKEMKDRSWIKWEKKKTNHHYINEITGRKQQPDFITATRTFEIVWYGNRSIAENEYAQIEPLFKRLINSIHS
jgi:hypothetical protein